jgi:predicted nucleotidyltransferase
MIDIIEARRDELAALCRKHHIKSLEIFGSAADGTFDCGHSDLDFLVQFLPIAAGRTLQSRCLRKLNVDSIS